MVTKHELCLKGALLKVATLTAALGLALCISPVQAKGNGNGGGNGNGSGNNGVTNPYSPAYQHAYRHGVVPTLEVHAQMKAWAAANAAVNAATGPETLSYGGGVDGIGVQSGHSKVYLVFWGTQWGTRSTDANGNYTFTGDSYGAAQAAQNMFKGIGTANELWSADLTQWCDGPNVSSGATSCPSNANFVPYQSGGVLAGVWYDNSASSPSSATAKQLGQEAVKAAAHFGNTSAASNRYAYYVILSPHGTNPDSYQGSYCAWHDWNGDVGATSSYGDIAFSNQPYNMDAGASCGVGFVNSGSAGNLDGWTMTLGHEWHEMMSDQNPAGGWTNHTGSSYNGQENSDECAWISPGQAGGAANISFSTGTFAEQASWSNDTNECDISHAIVGGSGGTPSANFTFSTSGLTASFTDTSTDSGGSISSHSWTFGDGATSSATNPSHSYTSAGTYSVTETVTDGVSGTSDSKTQSVTVASSNNPPVANFSYVTNGLVATFTDSSTDSDGSIASHSWTFGDGATSTATNPSHTYAAAGTYSVSLTVTDNGGATNTKTSSVTVVDNSNNVLSNGVPVTNLSATRGNQLNYTMSVPAGATNLSFAISGGSGDADLYVKFGSAPTLSSYDCRPYITGNNETCNISNVQAGTYYVMLNAYATFSGVSLVGNFTASSGNNPPSASFTYSANNLAVSFTDTSTDSDGSIASRSWNFGDGGSSTSANPSHTYASAGTYSVSLTVTDNDGATDSTSQSVSVTSGGGGGGTALQNGVPLSNQSGGTGDQLTYTVSVPAGASNLVIAESGGSGDADLYVKFGSPPTLSSYDCRPYLYGNNESCSVASPQTGTYYVMLNGYQAFSGVTIEATWSTSSGGGGNTLQNGVPVTGLSASTNNFTDTYTLTVPSGQSVATFSISGGTGDADLYVKRGSAPTTSSYDCRPYLYGNSETCTFNAPTAGTYYVRVRAYQTFSGVSLVGSYSP